MDTNIAIALKLLGVGMITVFLILLLVVVIGNLLIKVVNRYFPETEKGPPIRSADVQQNSESVDRKKVAAISAAVSKVTGGRGKVTCIEPL